MHINTDNPCGEIHLPTGHNVPVQFRWNFVYYNLYQNWHNKPTKFNLNVDTSNFNVPTRKGNKPHWREGRVLRYDPRYDELWSYFFAKFDNDPSVFYDYPTVKGMGVFWSWVHNQVTPYGGRAVYDMQYDMMGIHFDKVEDLIMFKLTVL